jgi:hypothetical protein
MTHWFSHVDMGASYPSEPVVLEELERVLDAARPTKLDTERSYAVGGSFVLAHSLGSLGDIDIEVQKDWADLKSVVIDRQIRATEFGPAWIQETARTVDWIIRGHYKINRTWWRIKILRTDISSEHYMRTVCSAWSRLPIPSQFLTHKELQLDYGCAQESGGTSDRKAGTDRG